MKKIMKDFRAFIMKGNVFDLAIGVIIGSAFSKITTSLVNDIFMPIITLLTGNVDYTNLFIALDGNTYATLDLAKEAGVATINYGSFISYIITFLFTAVILFIFMKFITNLREAGEAVKNKKKAAEEPAAPPAPTTKKCPFCCSEISIEATRCPHCTSQLDQ